MKQSFRVSLGAVVLALATLAAVIFAILNFDQRARFESPDDGVAWRDTEHGIEAWKVTPGGPAWQAGIRQGDRLLEVGGQAMPGAIQVTKRVWRAGLWSQLRYKVGRGWRFFETPGVHSPARKPANRRKLSSRCRLDLSFHRNFYLRPPVERAPRRSLLRLLSGVVHPLQLSLQRKTGCVRFRGL